MIKSWKCLFLGHCLHWDAPPPWDDVNKKARHCSRCGSRWSGNTSVGFVWRKVEVPMAKSVDI